MSALMQIYEPGQTPAPHEVKTAVGIDLGTTHSVVAVVHEGQAVAIEDAQGRTLFPRRACAYGRVYQKVDGARGG